MERNETITFIVKSAEGAEVTEHKSDVFCSKESTKRSEFYAAYQVNLNASVLFKVDALDWQMAHWNGSAPTEAVYNNRRYLIHRSYELPEEVEVICDEGRPVV